MKDSFFAYNTYVWWICGGCRTASVALISWTVRRVLVVVCRMWWLVAACVWLFGAFRSVRRRWRSGIVRWWRVPALGICLIKNQDIQESEQKKTKKECFSYLLTTTMMMTIRLKSCNAVSYAHVLVTFCDAYVQHIYPLEINICNQVIFD